MSFKTEGNHLEFHVIFNHDALGSYGVPVVFSFLLKKPEKGLKPFNIMRVMVINVVGKETFPSVYHESPYKGIVWTGIEVTFPGVTDYGHVLRRLTDFEIPDDHVDMFDHWLGPWPNMSTDGCAELFHIMSVAKDGYSVLKNHYAYFFHTLLYLEEYDASASLENYNMSAVELKLVKDPDRFQLEVPGLAEKRPSVLKGDLIYVRVHYPDDSLDSAEYEGCVVEVLDTAVWISAFHPEFLYRFSMETGLMFDVRFTFSRFSIVVMHKAIDLLIENNMLDVVFPSRSQLQPSLIKHNFKLELFNSDIESNEEQKLAVKNILLGECRPAPYIVFGPPGTGKSVTIVEAILQVKKLFNNSYTLVCAPSNAACDFLTQKLAKHCKPSELLRLHSSSRDWKTVPEDIYKFSNRKEMLYYMPSSDDIVRYRIVVCTLITASRFVKLWQEKKKPHFTHVFIDECGQALEPESLVAIGGILGPTSPKKIGGQLILAGDPKQLGPVCQSRRAEKVRSALDHDPDSAYSDEISQLNSRIGLGVSLLERLMVTCDIYRKNEDEMYDNHYITKLLSNYRSHPVILNLPNRLFYGNELTYWCPDGVKNDTLLEHALFGKKKSNKKGCPVVFHGVLGHEKREGHSPSYFNTYELEQVMQYLEKILSSDGVQQTEIGVIAPYIRQVYKLKRKLEEKGWKDIEVGSPEVFQGREKRVIIVTTVRANRNLLDVDRKFQIGFLSNPRRFNVAITRAESLLIVIGNPFMLCHDEYWLELMKYSLELNSYVGCKYQIRDSEWKKNVVQKASRLNQRD
ncbi:putative helicase mov-10-B.1 isoform X2 [Anabrus simplex]|uniref:putative helicase mov-10-B.1 isoform X2 n=1 Tax=Anabrus simplex TaxID=316456 RepID=UPI0034DD3CA7